ncbi:unnamed protein product [Blepharisma stoltei]|uniref:Uncharacterized protein n=1 Tax=Blepharisma stoltei TaxID=1481888 RepID=A0AAU9K1L2_9CILI|nr:unnamed protein product [Blepharisma stoltei]
MAHQNYEAAMQNQCEMPAFTDNNQIVWIPYSQSPITGELSPVFSANYPSIKYSATVSQNSSLNRGGVRNAQWTKEEDEILYDHVVRHQNKSWALIAKKINLFLHNGEELRQGKHCRERWCNHLDPNIKKGDWDLKEDLELATLHTKYGNSWSLISKAMNGRTENAVKNRWNNLHKRLKGNVLEKIMEFCAKESSYPKESLFQDQE